LTLLRNLTAYDKKYWKGSSSWARSFWICGKTPERNSSHADKRTLCPQQDYPDFAGRHYMEITLQLGIIVFAVEFEAVPKLQFLEQQPWI
jgi:hypothetical protein